MSNIVIPASSGWRTWTPSFFPGGTMGFSAGTINGSYVIIGNDTVHAQIQADGTTSGSASNTIDLTLPVTCPSPYAIQSNGRGSSGTNISMWLYTQTTTTVRWTIEGFPNFAIGPVSMSFNFTYRIR